MQAQLRLTVLAVLRVCRADNRDRLRNCNPVTDRQTATDRLEGNQVSRGSSQRQNLSVNYLANKPDRGVGWGKNRLPIGDPIVDSAVASRVVTVWLVKRVDQVNG